MCWSHHQNIGVNMTSHWARPWTGYLSELVKGTSDKEGGRGTSKASMCCVTESAFLGGGLMSTGQAEPPVPIDLGGTVCLGAFDSLQYSNACSS